MLPARGEPSSDYRASADLLQLQPSGRSCMEQLLVLDAIACEFNARTWVQASRIGDSYRLTWLGISPALLRPEREPARWYCHVKPTGRYQ